MKMRSAAAGHQKLTETNRDWIKAADSLTTTREVAEELKVNHSMVIRHLKQLGKVKKLSKRVPHELTTNLKKNRCSEVSSPLILCNNELFLN